MHAALWALALVSLLGAGISMLRPAHVRAADDTIGLRSAA
jgi:hypothetical protein